MKYLVAKNTTGALTTAKMKLQINGTDVSDAKVCQTTLYVHTSLLPYTKRRRRVTMLYWFHSVSIRPSSNQLGRSTSVDSIPRDSLLKVDTFEDNVYGVNYNILRIENGMGGLMYSN